MSLFGSLQTNYMPAPVQTGRLPTLPEDGGGDAVGNGGNAFLSLVDSTSASDGQSDGELSMYSALSPQLAYHASLIGSMLDDVTNGVPVVVGDPTPADPVEDLAAGSTVAFEAADDADVTNDLPVAKVDDVGNALPRGDGDDTESPVGDAGMFTNALPRVDILPA